MPDGQHWTRNSVVAILGLLASLITIGVFVSDLGRSTDSRPEDSRPPVEPPAERNPPPATSAESGEPALPSRALLITTAGTVTLRLLADSSPEHVRRFADLSRAGFYDGARFSRVVPDLLVEAEASQSGSKPYPSQHQELSGYRFRRGTVGFSTSGKPLRENGSLFILTNDAAYLNGLYTPLAEVVGNMNAIDQIAQLTTDGEVQQIVRIEIE